MMEWVYFLVMAASVQAQGILLTQVAHNFQVSQGRIALLEARVPSHFTQPPGKRGRR